MPAEELPEVPEWPEHELLAAEYATLGFYISGHPLDKYAGRLKDLSAIELATIEGKRNGEDIVVAGIIVSSRPMRSRRGARWMIVTLQDRTGVIEALVFPEAFQKLEPILKAATPLLVKGRVAVEDVGTRLMVSDARVLDQVTDRAPSLLRVRVDLKAHGPGCARSARRAVHTKSGTLPSFLRADSRRRQRSDARIVQRGEGRS